MKDDKEVIETTLYNGKVKVRFFSASHQYWVDGKRKTGTTTYLGILDKSRPLVIWATELARDYLLDIEPGQITASDVYKASSLHEAKKQEAAAIGDEVHKWVEGYIKGEAVEMPEQREAQIGVTAFLEWAEAHRVKFLSSERVVYSKKHDYIGKMDIEAEVDGKRCLIDIKTSNGLYNTYLMQTAAYLKADEEESGREYEGRWLIRLAKETEVEYLARMERKNENRVRSGRAAKEIAPYQVFEAMDVDGDDPEGAKVDRDFAAFLAAKELYEWNRATDFFSNKSV